MGYTLVEVIYGFAASEIIHNYSVNLCFSFVICLKWHNLLCDALSMDYEEEDNPWQCKKYLGDQNRVLSSCYFMIHYVS